MIKDKQDRVPNFVFDEVKMVHQSTGLSVLLISGSDASLRLAYNALKVLVADCYGASIDAVQVGQGCSHQHLRVLG